MGILIALAVACRWSMQGPEGYVSVHFMTHTRMDALCTGALLAWVLRKPGFWDRLSRSRSAFINWGAALSIILCCIMFYEPRASTWFMARYGYLYLSLFYAFLILASITFTDSHLSRFLRWRALRFIGKVSFCLYLIHPGMNVLAFAYLRNKLPIIENWNDLVVSAAAFAACLGVAYLSLRFFELPLLRIGQKYKYES